MVKAFLRNILNIVFPHHCVGCGTRHALLCDRCIAFIPQAKNVPGDTLSVFSYKDPTVRKAVWKLKYKGNTEMGEIFARLLYDRFLEELSEEHLFSDFYNPILVPIPLSKKRLKERGFNQSKIIAREMHKLDMGTSFTIEKSVLYKIKDTPSQVSIKDRGDRLRNLHGTFRVKDTDTVMGRNIILIDDVTTTGATIDEARKTLMKAGAKNVIAFTVAH